MAKNAIVGDEGQPVQYDVRNALTKLKFKEVSDKTAGGASDLKVTEATIKYLQDLLDDDRTIVVDFGGNVTTKK